MKIGIISDTHGHLPEAVHSAFEGVEHILHAGDIGTQEIISELETIAPVHAVHGNIDDWSLRNRYPGVFDLELGGVKICLTHNIVTYQYFSFELFRQGKKPNLVVFGHTHKAVFETYRNIGFLNPGSVYRPRGGTKKSLGVIRNISQDLTPEFICWD
jgi:putative phosphoesterase